jgi:hypothetical protein
MHNAYLPASWYALPVSHSRQPPANVYHQINTDALAKLGVPNAGLIHDILPFSPSSPKRIAGPVYTLKFVPAHDKSAPKLDHHFVDAPSTEQRCLGRSHDCWRGRTRCPRRRHLQQM